jgi:hypothetical protein
VFLGTRTGYCESRFESRTVKARVHELDLALRVGHAWDVSAFSLELGASAGATLFLQHFEAEGRAPTRRSARGYASAFVSLAYDLPRGVYFALDLEAQAYVLRLVDDHSSRAAFAGRSALLVGKHF